MNFENNTLNEFCASPEMTKVWQCQLDLLKTLLSVCKKYNLNIWANGGTLLGAIRHNGFIPWDDDIDMIMFREDYEKLIKIAKSEFSFPFFLQSVETENSYFRGHAQLRNVKTTAILPYDIEQSFCQGCFIDIFVLDYLPEDKLRAPLFKKLEEMRQNFITVYYGTPISRSPFTYIKSYFKILKAGGRKKYFHLMKSLIIDSSPKSDEIGSIMWNSKNYEKYACKVSWYRETKYIKFEDITIPIPIEYDKILKLQYGDYMKPKKEPSQHGKVIFNMELPYITVLKKLRNLRSIKCKFKYLCKIPLVKILN